MLSQNQLVAQRRVIEKTFDKTCSIVEFREVKNSVGAISFEEVVVVEGVPCRLSFKTSDTAGLDFLTQSKEVGQSVKLFLAPEVVVLPNSKVVVEGVGTYGKASKAKSYFTHQEVELELIS